MIEYVVNNANLRQANVDTTKVPDLGMKPAELIASQKKKFIGVAHPDDMEHIHYVAPKALGKAVTIKDNKDGTSTVSFPEKAKVGFSNGLWMSDKKTE